MYITGYYPWWWYSQYNPGITWNGTEQGASRASDHDYDLVDYIVLFSANPTLAYPHLDVLNNQTASANLVRGLQTGQEAPYLATIVLSAHQHNKKVLVSVGGIYGTGRANMSAIAANSISTETFVVCACAWAKSKNLDGIELDWEFPYVADQTGFINLTQRFREELDTWDPHGLFFSASYARFPGFAYTLASFTAFDQNNIMTYTMWQGDDQDYRAGFDTPILLPLSSASYMPNYNGYSLVDKHQGDGTGSLTTWLTNGFAASSIGISISFEATTFNGAVSMGETYDSWAFTNPNDVPLTNRWWDNRAKYWVWNDANKVISFLTKDTVSAIAIWAREKGLGGLMIYNLGIGWDSSQQQSTVKNLLLRTAASALSGTQSTTYSSVMTSTLTFSGLYSELYTQIGSVYFPNQYGYAKKVINNAGLAYLFKRNSMPGITDLLNNIS